MYAGKSDGSMDVGHTDNVKLLSIANSLKWGSEINNL